MAAFDWGPRQIMLVDRDDQFRFWARGLLTRQGVRHVLSLAHAADAMLPIKQAPPDLLLLEIAEDPQDGFSLLESIRQSPPPRCDIPVLVVLKALADHKLACATALGIHGIIRKPLAADMLLRQIGHCLLAPKQLVSHHAPPRRSANEPSRPLAPPVRSDDDRPGGGAGPGRAVRSAAPPPASFSTHSLMAGGPATAVPTRSVADWDPLDGVIATAPAKPEQDQAIELAPTASRRNDAAEWLEAMAASPAPPLPKPGPDFDAMIAAHAVWLDSRGAQGARARLTGSNLSGKDLSGVRLASALCDGADLSNCNLDNAALDHTDLRRADLTGCRLTGANLAVSRLRHARLRGADLSGANLSGADLSGADCTDAIADSANFSGAVLLQTTIEGTRLNAVQGLTKGQLESVRGSATTQLPPGLTLPSL